MWLQNLWQLFIWLLVMLVLLSHVGEYIVLGLQVIRWFLFFVVLLARCSQLNGDVNLQMISSSVDFDRGNFVLPMFSASYEQKCTCLSCYLHASASNVDTTHTIQ